MQVSSKDSLIFSKQSLLSMWILVVVASQGGRADVTMFRKVGGHVGSQKQRSALALLFELKGRFLLSVLILL